MNFRIALYKGTRPGIAGVYNRLVRLVTRSPYSHCELLFSDGIAASASWLDGGVRFKTIAIDPAHWDVINLPDELEDAAYDWFLDHEGDAYDLFGNVHFLFGPAPEDKDAWFCSEAVAAALGFVESWRFDPALLFCAALHISRKGKL